MHQKHYGRQQIPTVERTHYIKTACKAFGMEETMRELLSTHRLQWAGHLACMELHRYPKQLLFGEVRKKRLQHGTKKNWRDLVASDVQSIGTGYRWYDLAQDRGKWRALCSSVPTTGEGDQAKGGACAANSSNGNRAANHQCP